MSAAEYGFENPSADEPSWLALAQGVFNSQAARWDAADCSGGLRWQIFTWNNGYNYKNSPSNGGFFALAARLAAYTGNQTYLDWAEKTWQWMDEEVHLIGSDYSVYDGTSTGDNCTSLDHTLWTYTAGMMLNGCATMWNVTQESKWQDRAQGIWNIANSTFFNEQKIMYEVCEATVQCNVDQKR
jgi:mannan endo-1,6-alpha-mannosidase